MQKNNINNLETSKIKIEQLLHMKYTEAINIVNDFILERLEEYNIQIQITGIEFTGSQRFGKPQKNSDLDVVFTYESISERVKEDFLFNILNEDPLFLDDLQVDINPIEAGDIKQYILDASKYKKESLIEATKGQLLSGSQNVGTYKSISIRGKNRFARKRFSKIIATSKDYNNIDMNLLFKQDILEVKLPIQGETSTYIVTIKLNSIISELAKALKNNKYIFEYKLVLQTLYKIFNSTNIYIHCTCPDFKFNMEYWSIINNYSTLDSSQNPGPGKGIANPNNNKGRGCKHSLLVLSNTDWIIKVANLIYNYILYTEQHLLKPFQQIIFFKLYGMTEEEAKLKNIIPEEVNLNKDTHIIETINSYKRK